MNIQIHDPTVIAAVIQAVGGVLATTIAGIAAFVVGKRFVAMQALQEKLQQAKADIAFLLAVEAEHGRLHEARGETSNKLHVRRRVRNQGLTWTAKFTPGRTRG